MAAPNLFLLSDLNSSFFSSGRFFGSLKPAREVGGVFLLWTRFSGFNKVFSRDVNFTSPHQSSFFYSKQRPQFATSFECARCHFDARRHLNVRRHLNARDAIWMCDVFLICDVISVATSFELFALFAQLPSDPRMMPEPGADLSTKISEWLSRKFTLLL